MSTTKQKLITEIKEILTTQYNVKTLKEVIAASSSAAIKDLVKRIQTLILKH